VTAYNLLYVFLFFFCHLKHFVKQFLLYFSIFSFNIKVLTACVSDFSSILLMGMCMCPQNLKFLDILSCISLASTGNFLSEEKVVDILNDLNV